MSIFFLSLFCGTLKSFQPDVVVVATLGRFDKLASALYSDGATACIQKSEQTGEVFRLVVMEENGFVIVTFTCWEIKSCDTDKL